jgi:hypothetical protein
MTVPGVGAVVALSFKSAVDEPGRFRSSNTLGAHFGLTPRRHRKTDITGSISPLEDGPEVAAIHRHAMQHGGQLAGQRHLGALHPRRLATSIAQRCQAAEPRRAREHRLRRLMRHASHSQ